MLHPTGIAALLPKPTYPPSPVNAPTPIPVNPEPPSFGATDSDMSPEVAVPASAGGGGALARSTTVEKGAEGLILSRADDVGE